MENKELKLNLPQDMLQPQGDALIVKLKDHIKNGGKVKVKIQDQEEKTVSTEEELFEITAPYTNQ